jgi:hypothetical protein
MSNKSKAVLATLVTSLVALLVFGIGSGAVTNAGGTFVFHEKNVQHFDGVGTGISVNASNKTTVVNLKGKIDLASTGINTKTFIDFEGVPCGNTSVSYDTLDSGPSWKVTNHTSWNSQPSTPYGAQCRYAVTDGSSGDFPGDVPNAHMWGPNGCDKVFSSGISNGQTVTDSQDCTGTSTAKTQWSLMEDYNGNIRYACGYTAGGTTGYWTVSICSV